MSWPNASRLLCPWIVGSCLSISAAFGAAACSKEEPPPKTADDGDDLAFVRLEPIVVKGLSQPDSVVHDEEADVYLVTNINGDRFDSKADNGYISRISPEGEVLEKNWIDGQMGKFTLNAPRGIALTKGRIYVADIDSVRMFNRKTGASIGRFKVPGATDLNAVTAGLDGSIYISNSGYKDSDKGPEATGKDSIYRLSRAGSLKKLASGEDLNHPSGLAADKDGVWVITQSGKQLYHVSTWGKRGDPLSMDYERMEGLIRLNDGRLLVSVPDSKVLISGWPASKFKTALNKIDDPGGIGYDYQRERVLVPQTNRNKLLIQPLGEL